MASIYFQDIKTKWVDISLALRDGDNLMSLQDFQIGDELSLIWSVPVEIAEILDEIQWKNFSFDLSKNSSEEVRVFIPFRVIKRSHCAALGDRDLKYLGLSITVEAVDYRWEDLFRWLTNGAKPSWADL
jgi:hypothetical protein